MRRGLFVLSVDFLSPCLTGNGAFSNHVPLIPPVSDGQYNPATDSVDIPSVSRYCGKCYLFTCFPPFCVQPVDPSEYGLFYRMPPGCDPPTDCMYYVGMEVNASDSAYLDVYLTASVAGWVAVGFSLTPSMVRIETRAGIPSTWGYDSCTICELLSLCSGILMSLDVSWRTL